jgi:hypothetical protein
MKTFRFCKLLVLILINGIAVAQPGYYPPPSAVDYQTDTLTIYPPDSLPGNPAILLGYNIYIDGNFSGNAQITDPEEVVHYFLDDESLLPGNRIFCVAAVYNEWISENTCDTAMIIYGYELPVYEDWSSGSLETLQWSTNSDHWMIEADEGNPAPGVAFVGEPGITNYEAALESYPINALGISNGKIWLDFDIKLDPEVFTGTEFLKVEVWNWTGQVWYTVAEYSNNNENLQWSAEHINIKARAQNQIFRVRFLAMGPNSSDIHKWSLDNIHIYRQCDGVYDLQLEENIYYNRLDWWGYGGSCIDEWLHWDDGVNSGNSIGTGGAVEFDVAARWDHEQLDYLEGLSIIDIAFFPAEGSASYSVRIWSGDNPDTLITDQLVNSPVIAQWNYVTLANPVIIDITKDLWVGYHINTPTGYPAGVDDGPGIDGYGNMMYFEGEWQTLKEINSELDYNWNIACHIATGPPLPDPDWVYNIYRQTNNGEFELIATTPAWHYQDSSIVLEDYYCYAVTAVWTQNNDTCESSFQGTACESLMLGTGQMEQGSRIRIYPNPASSYLNIESSEKISEVRIYNMLGECVLKVEIGNSESQVDVRGLKDGIYFIEVVAGGKIWKDKVLIIK